ncbi:MAG: hypothetical protein K2O00_07845 [Muribaculaceae bacterium]|nr:hypothetical protein [Muribaculaceae bacterium]
MRKQKTAAIITLLFGLYVLGMGIYIISYEMSFYILLIVLFGISLIIASLYLFIKSRKRANREFTLTNSEKDALRYFEYILLPTYIERIKENTEEEFRFFADSTWKDDISLRVDPRCIDWGEISCELFGDHDSEYILLYDFPTPFDVPLAKYGVVYINKQKQIYNYFTLEKSLNGFMLCSPSLEGHKNYGKTADMKKIEFIKEVCKIQNIDESQLKNWRIVKRKSSVIKYMDIDGNIYHIC